MWYLCFPNSVSFLFVCLFMFYGDWFIRISCQWVKSHFDLILVPSLHIHNTCIKGKSINLITKICKYSIFIHSDVGWGTVWLQFSVKSLMQWRLYPSKLWPQVSEKLHLLGYPQGLNSCPTLWAWIQCCVGLRRRANSGIIYEANAL